MEKTRVRKIFCSKETDARYQKMLCDYGWEIDDSWNTITLPKKDKSGNTFLRCGDYVKNNYVSGQIVFYHTACCFRVKVLECRYVKDLNSISFFYPTPLGREKITNWEVYDYSVPLEEWLQDFPKLKNKEEEDE